jgi:aspartate kinase
MVVMKFGGSSVATAAALARAQTIVEAERRPRVVVVSALGGVTDALLALTARAASRDDGPAIEALEAIRLRHAALAATVRGDAERLALHTALDGEWKEVETLVRSVSILRHCAPSVSDAIVAHGELASSRLVAALLNASGLPVEWIDGRDVVVTDERHQHASPLAGDTADRLSRRVGPVLARGAIPVIGGFIGATADGVTTTLGRGGSDYSASIVGACLGAEEIQIWTDVDGILTADPRLFHRARPIDRLSFDEAFALARFGAKVLHPSTVTPAVRAGIPIRILNARHPGGRGTLITAAPVRRLAPVAGIASLPNLCVIDVPLAEGARRPAALAAVFDACARADAAVHLASISDAGVSVVVDDGPVSERVAASLDPQPPAARRRGLALVAAVGDSFAGGQGIAWQVLAACGGIPVHLLSHAPGSNHLALVIDQRNLASAVTALHELIAGRRLDRDADEDGRNGVAAPAGAEGGAGQEARA